MRKTRVETMKLTVKMKMLPSVEHIKLLKSTTTEYIQLVNQIVSEAVHAGAFGKPSSRTIHACLPSALKNQAIKDAKSVFHKMRKTRKKSILRKPVAIWNNQNWALREGVLYFPVLIEGKCQRIAVPVLLTEFQLDKLKGKLGTLRVTEKSGKWIAQISVEPPKAVPCGEIIMGVDLGLKVPAVAVTETGKTKFFGNGRQNKYMRRKYQSRRRKLGKLKKLTTIRKFSDKEQRWMKDQDHKISRGIVNMAIQEHVSIIRLEKLSGIRQTARTSRKNAKNLHNWTFYRLAQFIAYKAALVGICIEYVDPKYTSQTCPSCGHLNKAKDRRYECKCGYTTHRDRVGAINIIHAPVIDG